MHGAYIDLFRHKSTSFMRLDSNTKERVLTIRVNVLDSFELLQYLDSFTISIECMPY